MTNKCHGHIRACNQQTGEQTTRTKQNTRWQGTKNKLVLGI